MKFHIALSAAMLSLLSACIFKGNENNEPTGPIDTDGDGLYDDEEADLGTDPAMVDTDGDGVNDGQEVDDGTNPTYKWSFKYASGGYKVGDCPVAPDEANAGPTAIATLDYGGRHYEWDAYQNGDIMKDFILQDEWGQDVHLYSFCGQTVIITVSAEWCGPCQQLASKLSRTQDEFADENFTFVEVLYQNDAGRDVSADTLANWRTDYDLNGIPVVGPITEGQAYVSSLEGDGYIPTSIVIGADMTVLAMDEYVESPEGYLGE